MNFLYGVLVIAIAIFALKTVMKTAAVLWRWVGLLNRIGWRRRGMWDRSITIRTEKRALHPGYAVPDWQALSRELYQAILARGVRASSQARKLDQLDEAIEIAKREIELARLRAEKSQLKVRHKAVRSTAQCDRKRHGATQSVVPIAQLKAMREATRPGQSIQPTASPTSPMHH